MLFRSASGALDDASSFNSGDDISRELDALSSTSDVEAELARLKAGSASAPQAIEAGDGDILSSADEEPVRRESGEGGQS